MTATTCSEERSVGLIWQAATEAAAAHVLIVGVSRYASPKVPYVASPARSARAVAEWFLGKGEAGFCNTKTPLGSLAILLSEAEDGAESEVLGASVPRATFDNVEKAIGAWQSRAETGKWAEDNLLVLFVISHGESFGRRTAFLLEDYGTNPQKIRFGMSEVEQLVEAVSNLMPKSQLLVFDCCRLPTFRKLGFDKELGYPLLDPEAREDARQPMVLRSTALGRAAYGADDGLTVFTDALLASARGLAARPHNWVIDSSSLADTIIQIVGLQKRDGEALQPAGSTQSLRFPISIVEPTTTTTAFFWLGPTHEFASARFEERNAADEVIRTVAGAGDGKEFLRLTFADTVPRQIVACDAADGLIGRVPLTPYPPVIFQELPDRMLIEQPKSRAITRSGDSAEPLAEIVISVVQPHAAPLAYGAVATLMADRTMATALADPIVRILPTDGSTTIIELSAGDYTLVVASSSGAVQTRRFKAEPDTATTIRLELPASSNEFMAPALSAGTIAADTARDARLSLEAIAIEEMPRAETKADHAWIGGRATVAGVVQNIASVELVAALGNPKDPLADNWMGVDAPGVGVLGGVYAGPANSRHGLLTIDDKRTRPFRRDAAKEKDRPFWLAVAGPEWKEVAWCPSMGLAGQWIVEKDGRDPWGVEFVIDAWPDPSRSHMAAVVKSRRWTGLLAFLARRDFVNGGAIIDTMLADGSLHATAERAITNPLAATAVALMAIGAGRLGETKVPLEWLENLASFPNLPDGPVLLARERRRRGDPTDSEHIRALLLEAARRGVPGFSLTLDWLNEELALQKKHPDCAEPATRFRRLALMADPSRAFTVLRVS